MTANPNLVLAGLSGLGSAFELAWAADAGAALPTDATTALDTGFKSLGIVSEDGVSTSATMNSTEIGAFGTFVPVRTLITSETRTFTVTGRETNAVTLAIKSRLKLSDVTVDTTKGSASITVGPARDTEYSMVFHAVDGQNVIRKVLPSVRLTGIADEAVAFSANINYGFTFTAYPDSNGNSVYEYYILNALKV